MGIVISRPYITVGKVYLKILRLIVRHEACPVKSRNNHDKTFHPLKVIFTSSHVIDAPEAETN